ncbi:calbindin-32-like isoform X1 [Physella acuta]|uniref:calbindin-32-like isoform X1 n=1 Tax=Physella acuta TaxID=109671 RepID=UPI0027DC3C65|nr:calbindin-32-like isoform X1 [Physella acuta]XP_059150992.1 calbindin-32-like isoform X1 [Physella acuta]XP_059150993.1 calbindin-32-like isoform X1 [Physella acuta]
MAAQKPSTGSRGISQNFLRQFRDKKTRKFKEISASNFMDVWNHYDSDGNGYIEGSELDQFLYELVTSVNTQDVGPEVVSQAALKEAKASILSAFDENKDGKIDIAELAQLLPMEENFLLLFRREHPLESSVEFMKTWRKYDADHSGYIEADELKHFLKDLLKSFERSVTEEQLITYADTMLQLFDRNKDGKLQLSEMAKLLPVKENFLMRPIFKKCLTSAEGAKQLTPEDISRVFNLYDRDGNKSIEDEELHGFLKDLMELVQEDYDADDIEEFKDILLRECDLNHDGRIDKDELSMVLVSFAKASQGPGDEPEGGESGEGAGPNNGGASKE